MSREKYAWSGFGVPLQWLADFDVSAAENALPDAFGDSYLYDHNPVFARVRDAAMGLGYRFSAEDTPQWREYHSLSLTALPQILTSRTIPYLDTGTAFRRIVTANPQGVLPLGFIAGNLRPNYAFHESAHCVAHAVLEGRGDPAERPESHGNDRLVLHAILSESFANTVEMLGSVVRRMPVLDYVFYRLNSYWRPDEDRENVMARANAALGGEMLFRLLFFSYVEANLTVEKPSDSTFDRIIEASECPASHSPLAREVIGTGFELNPNFRDGTTPAYFQLLGWRQEYESLAASLWLGQPGNQKVARTLAHVLWQTVAAPEELRSIGGSEAARNT